MSDAPDAPLVIFDGACNLCAGSVRFILARERDQQLRFAAVQSARGQVELRRWGLDPTAPASFLLIEEGRALQRSDAALALARHLRLPWRAVRVLRVLPRAWRDAVYDFIAARRYRWFGTRDVCLVPTPALRARFFEE